MKNYQKVCVIGTIFVAAIGIIIGLGSISPVAQLVVQQATTEKTGILGHVTYIVTDSKGNTVSYLQTDNLVVNKGKNCALTLLFQSNSSNNGCTLVETLTQGSPSTTNGFNYISIGNGTGTVTATSTQLPNGGTNYKNATGQGSVVITQAAGGSGTAVLQKTFSFIAANKTTITSSGLFDKSGGSTMNMFSGQDSLATAVNAGDSLTVKWTITVG
jgi:hypothetical protein